MSLRARLLLIIGVALAVLWCAAAVWMFRDLDRGLQSTLDERLAMSARMVAGLLAQSSFSLDTASTGARDSLIVPGSRTMACQVRSLRGEIIATTRDAGHAPLQSTNPGYRTVFLDGQSWRTFTLRTEGFDVTTADRIDERSLLQRKIALAAGIPFVIAGIGGLLALCIGVGRALAPVRRLQDELSYRGLDATVPLATQGLPAELKPLVDAMNGLLERVSRSIQRERSFTSDAAHELRTPLTGIDTHLQVARRTSGETAVRALDDATTGVARMRATLDQLLMLARLEGRASFEDGERITGQEAIDRALDAAGGDPDHRVRIHGRADLGLLDIPAAIAVVSLRNVIDNALKYSPRDCTVDIELAEKNGATIFRIRDHGPGMSESELTLAAERFWRRAHIGSGVGLGLTLVKSIVERFNGSFELRRTPDRGLIATLRLPHGKPLLLRNTTWVVSRSHSSPDSHLAG
ncbi:ATP-binding protein [Steroidobacter cummioxidans]|uniref:ATP-binding protein n=1 Tax=Steroidobacter cummioxidans TaxID=1803913 RepID=UPI000E30E64F|nr:ATP-binding protein [Steroidobacter cummioxidans]